MRGKFAFVLLFLSAIILNGSIKSERSVLAQDSEVHPVAVAYAEAFRMSEEEAEIRLTSQNEMSTLADILAEEEEDYAGSWIQHEPELRFSIAFITENGEEILEKYLESITWRDLIDIEQVPYTLEQLVEIQEQVYEAALNEEIKTPFESGADLQKQKIVFYTPEPDNLRSELEASSLKRYLDDMEIVFQEFLSSHTAFLDGGVDLSSCTSGFVVRRQSDSQRFISTAGHCPNAQSHNSTNIGTVIFENDPIQPVGPFGRGLDYQAHNASSQGFDLRNVIQTGLELNVVSYESKGTTQGDWVCKHGKTTNQTCGTVVYLSYTPKVNGSWWEPKYVRVNRPNSGTSPMACPGDSGGPVYKVGTSGVSGLGLQSGAGNLSTGCNSNVFYFFYSPVDEINKTGHEILTDGTHLHQHVFLDANDCKEHITELDNFGKPLWGTTTITPCSTSAPGSGTIESYTAYVSGNYFREAMWRGGLGYIRDVPLTSNGFVDWNVAPGWNQCCTGSVPSDQGAYVLEDHLYQHVFWSTTDCKEHETDLDSSGAPIWGTTKVTPCSTAAPISSIPIESYTAYVSGGYLREAIWQNGIGYLRDVPLTLFGDAVNWQLAPGWNQCCTGTAPSDQGAYVLDHP